METEDKKFPATGMPDRDWWAALWPDPGAVLRLLGVRQGMMALDLCCGDGYFTIPFAQIVGGQVYGVDIDPVMLDQARSELKRTGGTVLDLICADAQDLPRLLPVKVDFVLLANTFHGIPDKTEMALAVAAVLKHGGQFAIINWHLLPRENTVVLGKPRGPKTKMRMSPDEVRDIVEQAEFKLDRIVELPPYHYGAVFLRA